MKHTLLFTLFLLFFIPAMTAQQYYVDDNSFLVWKIKVKDGRGIFKTTSVRVDDDEIEYVLVKGRIKKLKDQNIDPNKFSLVDSANRLRYKLVDFYALPNFKAPQGHMLLKKNIFDRIQEPSYNYPAYYPMLRDNFGNYSINGYRDVVLPVNFGSSGNQQKSEVYFSPVTAKKFYVDWYFPVIKEHLYSGAYALYYGDEKIAEIELD